MTLFKSGEGNTSLSCEEEADLLPNLTTKEELNQWERENIILAYGWALNTRTLSRMHALSEPYIRELHRRMFDQTWKWAGRYRTTEKNLGIPHHQIREQLAILIGDTSYWIKHGTFRPDEIAIRFHHRLVFIHPFANGNGRHARLMADVLARLQGRPEFSWGSADIVAPGNVRRGYIDALHKADQHDIAPLLMFARS